MQQGGEMRSTRVRWNNWDLQYASHTSEDDIGTLGNSYWGERTEEERYKLPIPHLHCPLVTRFLKEETVPFQYWYGLLSTTSDT